MTLAPTHRFYTPAYKAALSVMFTIPPEKIHHIISSALTTLSAMPPVCRLMEKAFAVDDPVLAQKLLGTTFARPLGLAAGFDKNAEAINAWPALGFGYAELGTVTLRPQPGNEAPRLFRLKADRGLINRMGFNNDGVTHAADRLRKHRLGIVGINIGKNKFVQPKDAAHEYATTAKAVGDLADYVTINVSSPNTPGLRDLQAVNSLRPIVEAVTTSTTSPVLVKIAPDLSDDDIDAIVDMAMDLHVAGIVATNTTISRKGLKTPPAAVEEMGAGGVSGAPLFDRALDVVDRIYRRAGGKLIVVGVGGIETPKQAWDMIAHGASLLQGYTGFIYHGPMWIRDIHLELARQVKEHGMTNLSQAVGCKQPFIPAP